MNRRIFWLVLFMYFWPMACAVNVPPRTVPLAGLKVIGDGLVTILTKAADARYEDVRPPLNPMGSLLTCGICLLR